eukprot:10515599-Alexandrium_andersonii.AAC.1
MHCMAHASYQARHHLPCWRPSVLALARMRACLCRGACAETRLATGVKEIARPHPRRPEAALRGALVPLM